MTPGQLPELAALQGMGLPGCTQYRAAGENANFRYGDASMAQIDYTLPRGLNRNQMERLASLDFVRKGLQPVHHRMCRHREKLSGDSSGLRGLQGGIRVLYANASKLMGTLKIAKNKGNNRS